MPDGNFVLKKNHACYKSNRKQQIIRLSSTPSYLCTKPNTDNILKKKTYDVLSVQRENGNDPNYSEKATQDAI